MNHHHDSLINIPLAALLVTMPWWISFLENTSWLAGKLVPILALLVGALQVWYLVRKLKR
jgi:hypothetical protein